MSESKLTLTIDEVAEELRVSKSSAYALIRAGLLQTVDVGTGGRPRTRVTRKQLEDYLAGRESNRPTRSAS